MSIGNERGRKIFLLAGALIEGHFRLNSGRDGLRYVAKGKLLDPGNEKYFEEICQGIADDLVVYDLDTLAGPQTGSVPYVTRVAEILTERTGWEVNPVFVEKCDDGSKNFYIKDEDKQHITHKKCGLLEDVTTSKVDGSLKRVVSAIEAIAGDIVITTVIWNRGRVTKEDIGVREFVSQIDIPIDDYEPGADCLGCKEEIPYDLQLGHGKTLTGHPLGPKSA